VQAEAPAGALFATARRVLVEQGASNADLAFYFLHWITDIGGADPTPLRGAVKFALQFPHAVFQKFITAFGAVQQLAAVPPAALLQNYLLQSWPAAELGVPAPKEGPTAMALLRLMLQAQLPIAQRAINSAFPRLPAIERELLSAEMARSGVANEPYSLTPDARGGPAFLIYYAPAFMQSLASTDAHVALLVLTDVYRAARAIWPLEKTADAEARTVTINVGALRGLSTMKLSGVHAKGSCWRLVQKGPADAQVEQVKLLELPKLLGGSTGAGRSEMLPLFAAEWMKRGAVLPWFEELEATAAKASVPLPPPLVKPVGPSKDEDPPRASLNDAFYEKHLAQAAVEHKRLRDMKQRGCVIDPQKASWVQTWDLTMLLPLIFTVVVTPVEIAFLPEGQHITMMFVINRVVDLAFVLDMLLSFNLAYQESADNGGHWVYNKESM